MRHTAGNKRQTGFTLIELLVVITILGVLASVVFSLVGDARASSRDIKRITDFREFATLLSLFYDQYGVYPCGDVDTAGVTVDTSGSIPFLDGEKEGLPLANCLGEPKFGLYTAGLIDDDWPHDPLNIPNSWYWYHVPYNRQSYILYVDLEQNPQKALNDGGLCPNLYEVGPGAGTILPQLPGC